MGRYLPTRRDTWRGLQPDARLRVWLPIPSPPGLVANVFAYRTAAIRTKDGPVKVARIEGNAAYRRFMRKETRPTLWLPEAICDILPSACPRLTLSDVSGTKTLLRQLRASVESHLGTGVCFTGVGLPDYLQAEGYLREVVEQALESIGLRQVGLTYEVSTSVTQVNFGQRENKDSHPRVILTVDYSQYGLMLRLYELDNLRLLDEARLIYNLTLGASNSRQSQHWESIRAALEEISRGPFGRPMDELPDRVERLVLHGDSTQDPELRGILEDVLGSELMAVVEEFEPVFSGAMGIARNVQDKVNWGPWVYDEKPVGWCCWHSKYHNCRGDNWEDRIEDGEL